MAHDRRYRLITSLATQLGTIAVANGYDLNLAQQPILGRLYFDETMAVPAVTIVENRALPETNKEVGRPSRSVVHAQHEIEFVVQGFVENDPATPGEAAYHLLAEIQKCLRPLQSKPIGVEPAVQLWVSPGVVRPPDELSKTWYSVTTVTAHLNESGDPYA